MSKEKKETLEKETKKSKKEIKETKKKKKDGKEPKKETKNKEKKKSIFSRIIGYFKGVKKEISRIRWTKGKELLKYSIAAVVFILFFCIFFYVIDMLVALLRSSL